MAATTQTQVERADRRAVSSSFAGHPEAELIGEWIPGNLKPYVVVERRRALDWLLSKEAWDDVSLDT